jgi:hypothetical protein
MGLFLVLALFFLFSFYIDQANRAQWLIAKHFPDFFMVDGKRVVEAFAPQVNLLKNISDVAEFRDSRFAPEQIPPTLQSHLRKMQWLKWLAMADFAAIWIYAFVF